MVAFKKYTALNGVTIKYAQLNSIQFYYPGDICIINF